MKIYAMEFGRTKTRGELALRPEVQRDYRILNGTVSLAPGTPGEEVKSTFQLLTPQTLEALMAWEKAGRKGPPPIKTPERSSADSSPSMPPRAFHMATRQEQAPNPDSRITLSSEKDALGMPRAKLDWRLTELDKRSIRIFYEVLGQVFGQSGTGRVQIRDWLLGDDRTWPSFISGGWHHMGTTRMHVDPKQGVVSADCRVHGLSNLYISGAAVYPTAGSANPTLTLVALSLRLSDYLKKTLA
jgi:choline dehydrogenase-like flavoprotein